MKDKPMAISRKLPYYQPAEWEEVQHFPADLSGAKIVAFGSADYARAEEINLESHGLIIEYIPVKRKRSKRIVFGFSDLGMWIVKEPVE